MYNNNTCNDLVILCVELVDPDLYFVDGWPYHDDCEPLDEDCNEDDDGDDDDSDEDTKYENGWYPGCDF